MKADSSITKTSEELNKYWNEFSDSYYNSINYSTRSLMLNLITLCSLKDHQTILDVGCGPGLSSRLIALEMKKGNDINNPDAIYYGIDISDKMVQIAKRDLIQGNILCLKDNYIDLVNLEERINIEKDNIEIKKSYSERIIKFSMQDAEKLMFEDEQFDVYLSNLCLQLVQSPEKMIAESFRVLKKGGFAGFSIWGKKQDTKHFHAAEEILKKNGVVFPATRSNYKLSENMEELKSIFHNAGFSKFKYDFISVIMKINSFKDFQNHFYSPNVIKILSEFDHEKRTKIENEFKEYYENNIENSDDYAKLSTIILTVQKGY